MPLFKTALQTVLRRSFGDKRAALAASASMHGTEIGRILSEEAPLTAEKLEKLLSACESPEDRTLLVHAAVRDFVGEDHYRLLTGSGTATAPTDIVQEGLGGPTFHAHFPIHPRAEQVLRYILNRLQSDGDVEQALILVGKFLELPEPMQAPSTSKGLTAAMAEMAAQIDTAGAKRRGKSAG